MGADETLVRRNGGARERRARRRPPARITGSGRAHLRSEAREPIEEQVVDACAAEGARHQPHPERPNIFALSCGWKL
eukprot:SAG11_NODE_1577_length_4652_cov_12.631013_5_plen_77_part_00